MTLALKAALLSALGFPGAGYFIVNKKRLGVFVVGITCLFLGVFLYDIYARIQMVIQELVLSGTPIPLNNIGNAVIKIKILLAKTESAFEEHLILNFAIFTGILWIISIIHGYIIGTKIESHSTDS